MAGMPDAALAFDADAWLGDLMLAPDGVATGHNLRSAIIWSVLTDGRARVDDVLPDHSWIGGGEGAFGARRGWWGDSYPDHPGDRIGCRLWVLAREIDRPEIYRKAEEFGREALAWMVQDGVATAVRVVATPLRPGWMDLAITITRPDGRVEEFRHQLAWAEAGL